MREQVHLLQPSVAEIIANELVGVYAETPGDMNTQIPQGGVYRAVYTDTPGGRVQALDPVTVPKLRGRGCYHIHWNLLQGFLSAHSFQLSIEQHVLVNC